MTIDKSTMTSSVMVILLIEMTIEITVMVFMVMMMVFMVMAFMVMVLTKNYRLHQQQQVNRPVKERTKDFLAGYFLLIRICLRPLSMEQLRRWLHA